MTSMLGDTLEHEENAGKMNADAKAAKAPRIDFLRTAERRFPFIRPLEIEFQRDDRKVAGRKLIYEGFELYVDLLACIVQI